ncbi:MAG TPA: hypothetical protein ENI62_01315 [Gammaproteobacteria bacterium]|nr:hypothetical protein [Gammaproteobacteria bacterium]
MPGQRGVEVTMAGFIHDPLGIVNLIADNLRDRYQTGFPVIKELIQNTDDAPASEFHYGLSSGLPGASHPLLQGPGLFLINNGEFKPSDARGIRSFGQNSKAAEQASIGKFGLGMKSVFHFCEAFFFLAHDGNRSYAEVLNPWSGDDSEQTLHQDWDEFEEQDAQDIRTHLSGITKMMSPDPDRCFILWLPLRRKSHLYLPNGERAGSIVSEYPGDDMALLKFLDEDNLGIKIAALIPMLRHVKRATYWKIDGITEAVKPVFEVTLGDGAVRPSLLDMGSDIPATARSTRELMKGRIRVITNTENQTLEFSGFESFGWTPTLMAMHNHELWPSSYVRDDLGHSREAKDKAQPHGAVFFSRTPGRGQLVTNWSVFLPLDEAHNSETIRCDGVHDFRLTLHGYFFIDAGRQGVHGLNDCSDPGTDGFGSEEELRRAWNCEILHSAVLPLLLPALDTFCTELPLADKSRTALTEALSRTSLLRRFREPITAQQCWIREITPEGVGWALRSNDKKVLSLPAPPENDAARPWRLFPSIKDINQQFWLSVEGAPNIVGAESKAQWDEQDLLDLLESIEAKGLFAESTLLDYFTIFLEESAGPFIKAGTVNKKLASLLKEGLVLNGEEDLGKNQQRVRNIVSHLDRTRCFRIDNQIPDLLLSQLLSADIDVLLVPARFIPVEWGGGTSLSVEDASQLLGKVQGVLDAGSDPGKELQKAALTLFEQFIKGVPVESRPELLRRCADLHVLGAFDCKEQRIVPVSVKDIQTARQERTLFGRAQGINEKQRLGLALDFQQVLPRERVLVINADTARLALNMEGAIAPCNGESVLRSLGYRARILGGLRTRTALAGMLGVPDGEEEILGLRFLLHADETHFDDDDALWILGEEQHPVWLKLWAQVVDNEDEPWNLLNSDIADRLSRDVARKIGIKEIRDHSVIEEIGLRGASVLNPSGFSQEECEQILRSVRDDDLWCSLPFHWTHQEKMVRGDAENVYLDCGGVVINEDLLKDVNVVLRSRDNELARRQNSLLRPLDDSAVIEIALGHIDVPEIWCVIMDALQSLDSASILPSQELVKRIKNSIWVPSSGDAFYKPDDIIDLEAAKDELDRILIQAPDTFTTPSGLDAAFLEHPFYTKFQETYFSRGQEGLERLALVIADLGEYQIGNLNFKDANALRETARYLSSYTNPGWRLLATLVDKMCGDVDLRLLASSMNRAMSMDAIESLLIWVADRGGDEEIAKRVFNRYLKVFSMTDNATNAVCRLKLLSQSGHWTPSEKLVSGVVGVAEIFVLHHEQAEILANLIFQGQPSENPEIRAEEVDAATQPNATAGILREYFQMWSTRVAPSITGAFVLLFGGNKPVKALCRDLLGQHSREWLIEQIPWTVPEGTESGGAKTWLNGFSIEQALDCFSMTVRVHDAETLRVYSILGELIPVGLEEDFSTLFVGRPGYVSLGESRGYRVDLVLRNIATEQCTDKQLSAYLRNSTTYLMREVYNQIQPRLDALWNDLDKSDQVDIELARSLILQNIPFYLKQLGAHKHPNLSVDLNRFREEERREQEHKGTDKEHYYRKAKEKALAELQSTIESDEGAQRAILESVRRKIKDFQYQPESVPFELFQNADDALHDLELIDAYPAKPGDLDVEPLPSSICHFVVEASSNRLVFMHWGRAINQFSSNGFPGHERGFDRDLENMLILSASDKGEDVTGKFGLGFKSVWLVSDRPTVVSGRLQAEIIGGLLPVPTQNAVCLGLRKRLSERQSGNRWPGTAIDLPLARGAEEGILDQFSKVAGVMVAFSRNVRNVDIARENGRTLSVSWEGQCLPGCKNIYIGHVRQEDADLLVMKIMLADGALLLAVGTQGFVELPRDIPNIWVTAPIREQESLGFAINAMFEVDAGRSRLSASLTENQQIAHRLGRQLASELDGLREILETRWEEVCVAMQLAPGLECYHFWDSLWRVFMARLPQMPRDSGSRVIATALLGEGLKNLSSSHDIVPNGLPGSLQRLIRWTDVKTVLKEALSDSRILEAVANASCFQSLLDTSTAASSDVATWLRMVVPEFGTSAAQWRSMNLSNLIVQLDADQFISPTDANILGHALNPGILESWGKGDDEVSIDKLKDLKQAAEKSRELKFLSANGTAERVRNLLARDGSKDEALRWAFAPDCNRLAKEYHGKALDFFFFCRDKFEAPAETLKEWIFQAEDSGRRRSALRYLIEGDLSRQVTDVLHESGLPGTWLVEVDENSEYLSDWDHTDRSKLIYQTLKTPDESRDVWKNINYEPTPGLEPIDPDSALQNIYEWWEDARDEKLDKYRRDTYPEGRLLHLADDDVGNIDRSSWLILLLLGGFHTMGRAQPEQHRGFVEKCQRLGWWDVFTDPEPAQRFNDWMGVLDQYIDQQIDQQEYEQWMMRFPIIYKLSRHLDDYVELLLGLETYREDFNLELVLMPLADRDQQGGGISAPPLGRTLGMGANFVIRELIRHRVADSLHLRKHAYVPYQRVRRLLYEMGCENIESVARLKASPVIFEFVSRYLGPEKADFKGDYDIPLQIVSEDWELQQSLLGREITYDEGV